MEDLRTTLSESLQLMAAVRKMQDCHNLCKELQDVAVTALNAQLDKLGAENDKLAEQSQQINGEFESAI